MNPPGGCGHLRVAHHADAGVVQEALASRQELERKASRQLVRLLAGDDGRGLDGNALGQQQDVAHLRAARRHQAVTGHLAQHVPHNDGPIQAIGDLGVTTS